MALYDLRANTPGQALNDLTDAAQLVSDHATAHPGRPLTCRIILNLPDPTATRPDTDATGPTASHNP